MKLLIATIFSVLTLSAQASLVATQNFHCLEESGFTYEIFTSSFNEIHQYDEKGEFLGMYDGLRMEVRYLETFPGQTRYSFVTEEGNEIAYITFIDGETTGVGEMVDHDQKMYCTGDLRRRF